MKEALFDACEYDPIGSFNCSVWLWMVDQGEHNHHAYTMTTKLFEELGVKLFAVVDYELFRNPKYSYDVLPEKLAKCFQGYVTRGFALIHLV